MLAYARPIPVYPGGRVCLAVPTCMCLMDVPVPGEPCGCPGLLEPLEADAPSSLCASFSYICEPCALMLEHEHLGLLWPSARWDNGSTLSGMSPCAPLPCSSPLGGGRAVGHLADSARVLGTSFCSTRGHKGNCASAGLQEHLEIPVGRYPGWPEQWTGWLPTDRWTDGRTGIPAPATSPDTVPAAACFPDGCQAHRRTGSPPACLRPPTLPVWAKGKSLPGRKHLSSPTSPHGPCPMPSPMALPRDPSVPSPPAHPSPAAETHRSVAGCRAPPSSSAGRPRSHQGHRVAGAPRPPSAGGEGGLG